MALTVASIVNNLDSYIGDVSNDRITAAERLQYITEATVWLQEELQNDLQIATYALNYYDNVHTYKVTTSIASLLEGADLRRSEEDQTQTFAHKSSKELAEEIGQNFTESSWAIERRDNNSYLVVNHQSKYSPLTIAGFDAIDSGGGTWALDATNGDGLNLTVDTNEKKQGSGSLNFDISVAQTANNKVILKNTTLTALDLSDYEDLGAFVFWVYLPTVTYFSSITLYWGTTSSAYWSATVTTDASGSSFSGGWNRVAVKWEDATKTSAPDAASITYAQLDINYTASQGDDTDFRFDDLTLIRPEKLTFSYLSWYVGETSTADATKLVAFAATTNVPYFSGQYDQYKYPVAHKAASLVFQSMRLSNEMQFELGEALRTLGNVKTIHPSSKSVETKSFKVRGINFNRRRN